jgi:hypothetical protein
VNLIPTADSTRANPAFAALGVTRANRTVTAGDRAGSTVTLTRPHRGHERRDVVGLQLVDLHGDTDFRR